MAQPRHAGERRGYMEGLTGPLTIRAEVEGDQINLIVREGGDSPQA
jgi:hypothetical protein